MVGITLQPRPTPAWKEIGIDPEGFLVSARIVVPRQAMPVRSTSELYDDMLGVRRPGGVLTIGDVVATVAAQNRLVGFEWRMGPAVLRPGTLAEPPGRAASAFVAADWDENGMADVPGRSFGVFDRAARALAIALGPDAVEWASLADGLHLGLGKAGEPAGLYLGSCPADFCALVGCP